MPKTTKGSKKESTESPTNILDLAYKRAATTTDKSFLADKRIAANVEFVCRCVANRAGVRMLAAALVATIHDRTIDIRKPFKSSAKKSKAGDITVKSVKDSTIYSGRTYDEQYVGKFMLEHKLPVNSTTAFLTPGYRAKGITLTRDTVMEGKPPELYERIVTLLNDVHEELVSAEDLLAELMRLLIMLRTERDQRLASLIATLKPSKVSSMLSAEGIMTLIKQHLDSPRSSRLPVLVVAAAYHAAEDYLGERALPLQGHNAADSQTESLGDVEIVLNAENGLVTVYEMKAKQVTIADINIALEKLAGKPTIDNYIFITTDRIDEDVTQYAATIHQKIGVEFVILDCIGFLRHFLHLFYRLRTKFLEAYQQLVLSEPDSAVNHSLKEAFLSLRLAAEAGAIQVVEEEE